MKKIRAAFVGIGGYGGVILKEVLEKKDEGVEIVAAADPYAEKSPCLQALRDAGVPVFADMDEMLAKTADVGKKPDLLSLATPTQFHTAQIRRAVRQGINVLCEKPLTGDAQDIPGLERLQNETDKFIAVGYQWSYSKAIQTLKKDISAGRFGKAICMKSLVFWPRSRAYFTRSTGWAGKICAPDGTKIYDSVVNNAAAHYIHNILYVLGGETDAAMPAKDVTATLLRTNEIETFDTATVRFTLENGARGMFVVSHSTEETIEPQFEYVFENGKILYPDAQGNIAAETPEGTIVYGDPFAEGAANKFFVCAESARQNAKRVLCGVNAAKEQVRFVEKLHAGNEIAAAKREAVAEIGGVLTVRGLGGLLRQCYREEKLLAELPAFSQIAQTGRKL